jgi:hypothetical protein
MELTIGLSFYHLDKRRFQLQRKAQNCPQNCIEKLGLKPRELLAIEMTSKVKVESPQPKQA